MSTQDAVTPDTLTEYAGHPRRWLILAVMSGSLILVVVTLTALHVALPSIQRGLDASGAELQWIIDSYVLVFAGLLLLAGSLGDHYGRRGALIGGLVVYGVAAGLTTFADDANQVIAGRAVMGIGAALILSLLGVPRETITADYLLSNDLLLSADDGRSAIEKLYWGVERAWLEATFESIETHYGSVDRYIETALGIDAVTRERIKSNLLR